MMSIQSQLPQYFGRIIMIVLLAISIWPVSTQAQPVIDIEYVSSFGSLGTNPGQFNSIGGVTVDNGGYIYVSDNDNHRIQVCDYQGNCEADGGSGAAPGEFQFPIGIAIDHGGRIVVSDGRNFRIQIRDLMGAWSTFGKEGTGVGQFRIPGGLAIDAQNRIMVADENNGRVQSCSDQGSCTVVASGFETPRAIGIDTQGRLVISDRFTNRIHICVPNSTCTYFGSTGTTVGKFRSPTELWVDDGDRIYVVDRDNNRFQVCDLDGSCAAFGQTGVGAGQFNRPTSIAVDDQNRIIVGDGGNNRVQIFQATLPQSTEFQINSGLNDAWYDPETSGQGFFITVFPDLGYVSLAWFTYDTEPPPIYATADLGDPGHRWLTAVGPIEGNQVLMDIEMTSGGLFDTATEIQRTDPPGSDGTILLTFDSCNSGTAEYDIPSINRQGVVPIQRVAGDNISLCEALNSN